MRPDVVVFNGGASSGKTTLAQCVQQRLLPEMWLRWSRDDFLAAIPLIEYRPTFTFDFESDDSVPLDAQLHRLEAAWLAGIAAAARTGTGVLLEEVFLGGGQTQERLRRGLNGAQVLWIGVRCDAVTAVTREAERYDQSRGVAGAQATRVHRGVSYDVEVDTGRLPARDAADIVLTAITTG